VPTIFDDLTVIALLRWLLGCVTLMLTVGLVAAVLLRRRPARAHAAIVLSLAAALVVPLAAEVARRADVGLLAAEHVLVLMPAPQPPLSAPPLGMGGALVVTHQSGFDLSEDPRVAALQAEAMFDNDLSRDPQMRPDYAGALARSIDLAWVWSGALAWGLLSVLVIARTVGAACAARWLVARATDTAPEFLRVAAERAAVEAGVRRRPVVRVSDRVASPVVWCWGLRPVIVVPSGAPAGVDWAAVMRHELAHWTRRDHLADALGRCVIVLVPFHPLAWIARAQLERLAERACDDWAVSRGEGTSYAQSLVTLAARVRGPRVALPIAREGSDLAARVRRVLNRGSAVPRAGRGWLMAGVMTASCATALVALARHPVGEVRVIDPPRASPGAAAEKTSIPPGGPTQAGQLGELPAGAKPSADKDDIAGLSLEQGVQRLYEALAAGDAPAVFTLAGKIGARNDPRAIPLLIGVIDSDNTYPAVYGVGYFGLGPMTDVPYDHRYDGTWWKAWWQKNRARYPSAATVDVPVFPPTGNRIAQVYDFGEWAGLTRGEPPERVLKEIERRLADHGGDHTSDLAERLVKEHGPRAIPWLIGVIDADNNYETIYGVGHFGLSNITGVAYDDRRDGTWWRAWWEKNKAKFPLDAQRTPIPELKKSTRYVRSVYDWGRWVGEVDTEPVARMVEELKRRLEAGAPAGVGGMAQQLAERNDPAAIPDMIALIQADKTGRAKYDIGYFGLRGFTRVDWDESHDGAWWGKWWDENKGRFAGRAKAEIPKVELTPTAPGQEKSVKEAGGGTGSTRTKNAGDTPVAEPADIADVLNEDILIGGDVKKRYFLINGGTGDPSVKAPAPGRPLLIILPGGDGSADFNPFVRRIWKNALPKEFVVAQAVAPRWRDDENRVVWPTEKSPDDKMTFTTESFIEEIVADAKTRAKIDPSRVYALGWSSSGPPVYVATVRRGSSLAGAFVAMSVYHPETMPALEGARGKSFYVLHSPQDFIKMTFPQKAVEQLKGAGARTTLVEYEGGHGWHGDIWKTIRDGVEWMMGQVGEVPGPPEGR
jgi:poly(3-hydroxybutyrate) depolymerase